MPPLGTKPLQHGVQLTRLVELYITPHALAALLCTIELEMSPH